MLDVIAFRIYYRLFLAGYDEAWQRRIFAHLEERYPPLPDNLPVHVCASINSKSAERFIREQALILMIARCKQHLRERIFSLLTQVIFVFHPGICPRYRNAHGCFWALAKNDLERMGMIMLRIDNGDDTGPIYGYYSYDFDAARESHHVILQRVVLDNLPALSDKLQAVFRGEAEPIQPTDEVSVTWGQPWLSQYLRWRHRARRRQS